MDGCLCFLCLYSHLKVVNLQLEEYCHGLYLGTIYNFWSKGDAMFQSSGAVTLGLHSFEVWRRIHWLVFINLFCTGVKQDTLVAVYRPILHKVPKQRKPQFETEFGQNKEPKMESRKCWYSLCLIINPGVLQQHTYLVTNQLTKKHTNRKTNSLDQCPSWDTNNFSDIKEILCM